MEILIEKLHTFSITQDSKKFNESVDYLLTIEFEKASIQEVDPDIQWTLLKRNYSNLKYINELLNHYNYNLNINFYNLLDKFLQGIDKTTQEYLQEITWDDDYELITSLETIQLKFRNSLNENDFDKKIKLVLDGYSLLIPIVEDFRREKCEEVIDQDFRNLFSPKRLKM
jgi:hypothetical protein